MYTRKSTYRTANGFAIRTNEEIPGEALCPTAKKVFKRQTSRKQLLSQTKYLHIAKYVNVGQDEQGNEVLTTKRAEDVLSKPRKGKQYLDVMKSIQLSPNYQELADTLAETTRESAADIVAEVTGKLTKEVAQKYPTLFTFKYQRYAI